ncbi:hypothetical protein DXG01_014508 [Tephrocybe rancida]|nr:hypothetical protein DXG01_014508 [Tephrocybe rancida]
MSEEQKSTKRPQKVAAETQSSLTTANFKVGGTEDSGVDVFGVDQTLDVAGDNPGASDEILMDNVQADKDAVYADLFKWVGWQSSKSTSECLLSKGGIQRQQQEQNEEFPGSENALTMIPCPRESWPPMQSTSLATERFHIQCLDIISRVEWLNVETGRWLFFAGQHSNATSTNTFFHYGSNKSLILLNKKEAVNLNKQYADSEQCCQRAVQDAQLARQVLAECDSQADLMFDLLQKLQSGALESHEIPNLNTMRPSSNCT